MRQAVITAADWKQQFLPLQTMVDRAQDTIRLAKEREERALTVARTFDTDAAQFQSELNRVSTGFENDLGDICGLFPGADGRQYPAIPKFAAQSTLEQQRQGMPQSQRGRPKRKTPGRWHRTDRSADRTRSVLRTEECAKALQVTPIDSRSFPARIRRVARCHEQS